MKQRASAPPNRVETQNEPPLPAQLSACAAPPVGGYNPGMCGRYTIRRLDGIRAYLDNLTPMFEEFSELRPRFNVAPSQRVPIIRMSHDGHPKGSIATWGLIPSWAREVPKTKPINCRCETVASSAMFRQAFARHRCLMPADGFYEWQGAKPPKQPFFIHRPHDEPFCFAGIMERWKPPGADEPVETCSLITSAPNSVMKSIHNRMPVILHRKDWDVWLSPETTPQEAAALLKPYDGALEAYPVSTLVNKPANDSPELIERGE